MKTRSKLALCLGIAVAATLPTLAPRTAAADDPCASPPPTPRGHVLARIEKVEGNGAVVARFGSDATGRLRPKVGDEAYLLKCNGARVGGAGDVAVKGVSGSTIETVIGLPAAQLTGKYIAIDSGFDSQPPLAEGEIQPPSGYVRARVLDVKVVDGVGARIVVSRGPSQGVLPGAKAYLVTAKGHPANNGAFTIAHALSNRAVAGTIPHTTVDNVLAHQDVFVEAGKPCQAPSPVELDGAQLFAASKGTIPAGWAVVPVPRERSAWPEFHVGKGAKDGVQPGKAWILVGAAGGASYVPAQISDVGLDGAKATVKADKPETLKGAELRLLVNASATCPR